VQPMSPLQQRILAVLLLVALIAAAVVAVGIPLRKAHARYDDRLEEIVDKTARWQRVAKQRTQMVDVLNAMRTKDPNRFALKNSAANLAGAELQDIVRSAVEVQGGRINTIQISTPREESGHRVYVVSTTFQANVNQLQKILHASEAREPYVFIDSLNVRSMTARGIKPTPGQEPLVLVTLEASAFAPMPPIKGALPDKKPAAQKAGEKA
jgi:general secretion pathway protein M